MKMKDQAFSNEIYKSLLQQIIIYPWNGGQKKDIV